MYRPDRRLFAFRLRRRGGDLRLEGLSHRYTAAALIGLASEPEHVAVDVLAGQSPGEVCGALIGRAGTSTEVGEVALTLWAARRLHHPAARRALLRLRELLADRPACPTVELAWALLAQAAQGSNVRDEYLTDAIARRLMASFRPATNLFPHWPAGSRQAWLRAHVTCFADLVYPTQALAHYYLLRGDQRALTVARRCAQRICELQGPAGQWWWHYDVRSGHVLEPFPVYAVHQDAMAPMALLAVARASGNGAACRTAVERGLAWLEAAPELSGQSLIDRPAGIIWRKVGRWEPGRLVRGVRASSTRLHPALRLPGADLVFPPGRIDYETRPYHMGWILYAWNGNQTAESPSHS